jgi:hypothetical protein
MNKEVRQPQMLQPQTLHQVDVLVRTKRRKRELIERFHQLVAQSNEPQGAL